MKPPKDDTPKASGSVRLLMDVDTGVDDALAICLACRRPEARLELVTSVAGNTTVERATANTLLVLEQLGLAESPPAVARGSAKPLERELLTAPEVHGEDGLGGASHLYPAPGRQPLEEPAWKAIAEAARAHPEELTLVATGPLTNLALALRNAPEDFALLRSLVVMGGTVEERGNVSEHAEFNIYVDPEAADTVFSSGLPLTLIPLDVTHQVVLEREELNRWKRAAKEDAGGLLSFIEAFTDLTMTFHGKRCGIDGLYLHDPLAVAVALEPSLVEVRGARLKVESSEARRGKVIARWDDNSAQAVAVAVDAERLLALLTSALAGL